jgi:hypothetical protein
VLQKYTYAASKALVSPSGKREDNAEENFNLLKPHRQFFVPLSQKWD